MKLKLFSKKIFKGNLSEIFLIVFEITLAAIGGYLISIQQWFFVIIAFLFSFIINFIHSKRKQDKILFGTSEIPGSSSNFPEGTIYMKYKK